MTHMQPHFSSLTRLSRDTRNILAALVITAAAFVCALPAGAATRVWMLRPVSTVDASYVPGRTYVVDDTLAAQWIAAGFAAATDPAGRALYHEAAVNPGVNDDVSLYPEGTIWRNTQGTSDDKDDIILTLLDDTDGAAVWRVISGGSSIVTTSGNVTLTTASPRWQKLTPDADRDVTLPAAGLFVGDWFEVESDGGTAYNLTLKTSGGTSLFVIPDKGVVIVKWDGTAWE